MNVFVFCSWYPLQSKCRGLSIAALPQMPVDQIFSSVRGYYDQYQPPFAEADTSQASERTVSGSQHWAKYGL